MAAAPDSTSREIPAHVPRELVHSIGLTEGAEFLAAPHQFMAGLHDTHPPIFYSPSEHTSSAWMLTKYDDVCFVLTHPKIFTTQGATPFVHASRRLRSAAACTVVWAPTWRAWSCESPSPSFCAASLTSASRTVLASNIGRGVLSVPRRYP
jgi:hypothetical protein